MLNMENGSLSKHIRSKMSSMTRICPKPAPTDQVAFWLAELAGKQACKQASKQASERASKQASKPTSKLRGCYDKISGPCLERMY